MAVLSTLTFVCLLLSGFPSEFTSRWLEEEEQNDDRIVAGFSFPFSPEEEPFLNFKLMRGSGEGRCEKKSRL